MVSYFKAIQSRAKLEMSLATRLYNICTRYDLLVKNADFYKLYMDNELFNFLTAMDKFYVTTSRGWLAEVS